MTATVIQAQIAAAQITGLEPIAGAGLTFNLAYLALDRFRYRLQIEPVAEQRCKQNDERAAFEEFHDLDPVKELKWLARRQSSREFVPKGWHAATYRYGFRKHQDIMFCIGAIGLCAFTLISGVAQNVGRWAWTSYLMAPPIPGIMFYGCFAAIIVPAISVIFGRAAVAWAKARIENCTEQIAIHLKALATTAEPPKAADDAAGQPVTLRQLFEAEVKRREKEQGK